MLQTPIYPIINPSYVIECYRTAMGPGAEARSVYRVVFARAIEAFQNLAEAAKTNPSAAQKTLNDNLMLWESFVSDLETSREKLPPQHLANMISLRHFVRNHTKKLKQSGGPISPLIDINQSVLDGLSGPARSEPTSSEDAPQGPFQMDL